MAILIVLFLAGIAYLAIESLHTGDGYGLGNFAGFFARADYVAVLIRTIGIALAVTLFSALIGYPIAYATPNLHIVLGYNGRGVALATQMGRYLARTIAAGESLPYSITSIRPLPFHGLKRFYIALGVAYYGLCDKFL